VSPVRRARLCAVAAMVWLGLTGASAQPIALEPVTFPSLDGKTTLQAIMLRPREQGPRPAVVLLHGCTGLQVGGAMLPIYRVWARLFATRGYLALVLDSAGSRGFGETCTRRPERLTMFAERPKDAYAALQYLRAQPTVRADRIGVIGWSQGGATILLAIAARSSGRPSPLTGPDFRAAVALYPGLCNDRLQSYPFVGSEPNSWTTSIPLLVLHGEADNWTPAAPCQTLIAAAKERGAPVEFKLYPDAHHVFDAPNAPVRELPAYRLPTGVIPLAGTEPLARADAIPRTIEFFERHLMGP
jgi:dienelactone hydrolase